MDMQVSLTDLIPAIRETFIHQDQYKLAKHIEEFKSGDTYLGDFLYYSIFEPRTTEPPVMYSIMSPYDMVSKKAPQQALVFSDGKLLLNIDYTKLCDIRTGVMDALVLQALGNDSLENKKILYIGTGKVAQESLQGIHTLFPNVREISFYNRSQSADRFGEIAQRFGIEIKYTDIADIGMYDIIFCHTNSAQPVLTADYKDKIKSGAVITTFVTVGSDKGELADEFFDTDCANIIIDWEQTLVMAKELQSAIDTKLADASKIITLQQLFLNKDVVQEKKYTVYRSVGTPMQNVAVLKLLLGSTHETL